MIQQIWKQLVPLLPNRGRAKAALLILESLLAGILEAGVLVLVVNVALTVSEPGTQDIVLTLPLIGGTSISTSAALLTGAVAGVSVLIAHTHLSYLTAMLAAGVLEGARQSAIHSFSQATWARQSRDREGALQETISTLALQTAMLVMQLGAFAVAVVGLAALLAVALVVDPVVTLVVLAFGALLFAVLRPVGGITRRRAREFVKRNTAFAEEIGQWSGLAMDLRVFGVEKVEAARLSEDNRNTAVAMGRSRFMNRAGSFLYKDIALLFLIGAVGALHLLSDMNLTAVGAVVLLIVRALGYAQSANSALQSINEQNPNLESLQERVGSLADSAEQVGTRVIDRIGWVELDNVGYDYDHGQSGVADVTIQIAQGETIGVIGPSGGGKSTLVQVLLRLRPPTRGSVTVSGIAYEEIEQTSWHRLVALVPQEPKLFQGSVADNIAFLRSGVSRQDIEEAAAAAHVRDDILRLPNGFDTELGPRGAGLSGGQRQRVAIARALVGKPQLLVLDEPTSALDVRSEQLLRETIAGLKGQVTLVIVAHRLTTLSSCDRVVAMRDGRVELIGTLDEALAQLSFGEELLVTGPEAAESVTQRQM